MIIREIIRDLLHHTLDEACEKKYGTSTND